MELLQGVHKYHPVTNRQRYISFRIPLKHIFSFCEDYDKIVYGLISGDDVIFRAAEAGPGKVRLEKMSWFMPHIISADAEKFSIYKTI